MPGRTVITAAPPERVRSRRGRAPGADLADLALREVAADARRVGAIWPLVQALSALARLTLAALRLCRELIPA
uniref:hypothetical protein n=1 Tax=Micromonospora acroterricola TaxID=2202421 RepID=UPI0011B6509C|nr:hypothetical protein [Micromonospora acroterricola]